jgi:hypothetical protein
MKLDIWSANAIKDFEFCPMNVYLKNSYPVRPPPQARNFYNIWMHNVLSLFWTRNFNSPESFADYWEKYYWPNAVRTQGGHEKFQDPKRAEYMISRYEVNGANLLWQFYKDNIWKKKENRLKGNPSKTLKANFSGFNLEVKIDEMCMLDDGVHLIDYTMAKRSPEETEKSIKANPKVVMMSLAFRENYGEGEAMVCKNLIRFRKTIKTEIKHDDHMKLIEKISEIKKKFENDEFESHFGNACKECEYFDIHYRVKEYDRSKLSGYRKPAMDYAAIFEQESA